jgi:chromosome segregation ATPase
MNVANDNPGINYVDYFTKQLPRDLAAMAQLRDELAIRQGALDAAAAAVDDRKAAAKELADAKTLLEEVRGKNADAAAKGQQLKTREEKFSQYETSTRASLDERERQIAAREAAREAALDAREKLAAEQDQRNQARERALTDEEAALASRVKAFQEKVAALRA